MAFIEEADYEEWQARKRREGRARAQRPESPWSLMPPAPASPMPGISASQPLPGSQTAPIMPAWAPPPPPPPAPPLTPWQQTRGRYTPEFDEPMPSFTPTPGPTIPLPGAPDTAQVRPSYGIPGFPMAPEMAGDIEALRRWKAPKPAPPPEPPQFDYGPRPPSPWEIGRFGNGVPGAPDLPAGIEPLFPEGPLEAALRPQSAGFGAAVAARQPNATPQSVIEAARRGITGEERATGADVVRTLPGMQPQNIGGEVFEDPMVGVLGFGLDVLADPWNVTPLAIAKAPGLARAAAPAVRKGAKALNEAVTSPTVRRMAPGAAEIATTPAKNAISGLPLGSVPEAGGGVVGALAYQDDPSLSPEENAQRRLLFAAGGAGLSYAGRRLGSKSRLGGTIEDVGEVAAKKGDDVGTIKVGDRIRTSYSSQPNEVLGEGSVRFGKERLQGYRVRRPDGAEDFISKDDAIPFREPAGAISAGRPAPDAVLAAESTPTVAPRVGASTPPAQSAAKAPPVPEQAASTATEAPAARAPEPPATTVPGAQAAPAVAEPAAATVPPGQPPRAPAGTGQATPPERPGFAGNIRLAKYPEELRDELKAVYDNDPAKFETARRGVRPDAEVRADAEALIDSVGGKGEKSVRKWSPGQAWNAEEVLALREVLAGRTRNVLDAQRAVREGGDSTENLLRLRLALEDQGAAQKAVAGVTAEAGRALRQFRQDVGSAIASGDVRRMERLLATRGGREKSAELADKLAKLDIDNPDQVNSFIRGAIKPGMTDYLTELFYNSILSGPKTHMVNAISNTLTALGSPIERAAAAAVEVPLAAIQRRPRERFFGEVPADAFGLYQGLPEGIRAARYVLKHGFTAEQATKLDFPHQRAFTGKVGEIINAPSTALEAADQFYRAINNRAAMNALAYRQAAREGLKGNELASRIADILRDPSKELLEQAERTSMYRLFRQEPGSVASKVIGLREAEVLGFKPLRFVIPFVRTPANLLKFGLERSPAGWLNPKMWGHIAKKDPEAADEIARAALGSMLAATVALYAADGRITGAAPTSAAERDRFYREGKQAYAYKVGDTWWQYNRMEPFNQAIGQVAAVVDAINAKDKTADQKAMQAVTSIAKGVVSQTYLSGLADFIEGLSDPLRSGEQVGTRVASALAVPFSSAARTIAQATDPVFRRPQGFVETVQANVPGLSENVPARLTAFGEEARRESPLGETFRAVSPISVTPAKSDPVDQELGRLGVEVGFTGKSIQGIALTEDEQRGYQKVAGRVTKADLDEAVTNPEYQRLNDRDRAIELERIIRKARDRAGAAFLERFISEAEMERRLTDAQAR